MTDTVSSTPPASSAGLLGALDALRAPGNVALMALGSAGGGLLLAVAANRMAHGSALGALIAVALAAFIASVAYTAVTLRQWQRQHGQVPAGLLAGVAGAVALAVKVLLALLLLLAGVLAGVLAACVLFLLTQIPGIGPALNYLVFPLVALVIGVALYALCFIAAPLATVAACDGRSVPGIVATVVLVVRRRLFDTALRGMLLNLVALAVLALALGIVTTGVLSAAAVQHAVQLGQGSRAGYGGGPGLLALASGLRGVSASAALLYFLAASAGMVVLAAGWVVIFQQTVQDLDPRALEAQLRAQAERARQGARTAQEKAARLARDSAARGRSGAGDAGTDAPRDPPPPDGNP